MNRDFYAQKYCNFFGEKFQTERLKIVLFFSYVYNIYRIFT